MCLAVPGKLMRIEGDDPLFRHGPVDFAGVVRDANLAYVPEAKPGDYVLVHAGFAIAVIDEAQALQTLADLTSVTREDAA
jgi:hydrogenase expression/formation protein HypC